LKVLKCQEIEDVIQDVPKENRIAKLVKTSLAHYFHCYRSPSVHHPPGTMIGWAFIFILLTMGKSKLTLADKEQALKIKELKWKIKDLETPEYKKLSTWTGIGAIAIAIAGLGIQFASNQLESQIAELKLNEARQQKAAVDSTLKQSQSNLQIIRDEVKAEQAKVAEARIELQKLNDAIANSTLPPEKKESLLQIASTTEQQLSAETQNPTLVARDSSKTKSIAQNNGTPTIQEYPDDPQKGKWGMQSKVNGREITAEVKQLRGNFFDVTIKVVSTDPNRPLQGQVIFHLHNTFVKTNPVVNVVNGEAVLILRRVYGSFTVGAEADNRETRLEFDLVDAKGATEKFRTR
jgi:hypothetical protein